MRKWFLTSFCLLFLLSLSFAAPTPEDSIKVYDTLFQILLPGIALIVVAMLGITHMLAQMFDMPQLSAWVKVEIREIMVAAILAVIIYVVINGPNILFTIISYTGGDITNFNVFILSELDSFRSNLYGPYNSMIEGSYYIGLMSGYWGSFPTPEWYVSVSNVFSPYAGASVLQSPLYLGAQGITGSIFIYSGMKVLFQYFSFIVPTVLIPLALSLRFIPFTRKIGNTLIALCLGAVLVYPASIYLVSVVHGLLATSLTTPILDTEPMKLVYLDYLDDISKICTPGIEIDDMDFGWGLIKAVYKNPEELLGLGLGMLKLTESIYALIACVVKGQVFPPWQFLACYSLESQGIYNLILTLFQFSMGTTLGVLQVGLQESASSLAPDIFDAVQIFLSDVNILVVMSYVDVLLVAIMTIVGTRSISIAIEGESYLAGIERLI